MSVGVVGTVAFSGTASANCPCEGVKLGKIGQGELPACGETTTVTLTLDGYQRIADDPACQDDKDVDVEVTATDCKDGGEVTCVDLKIVDDNGACGCADDGLYFNGARVKGGSTEAEYTCGDTDDTNQVSSEIPNACAPINDQNSKRHGISHIDVYVCVFEVGKSTGDNCVNNGGE